MDRTRLPLVVVGRRQLTPTVVEFLLRQEGGPDLSRPPPGAHLEIFGTNPENGPFVRHYSIVGGAGLDDDPAGTYRIAVQRGRGGGVSAFLHAQVDIGARLVASRPKNAFPLDRTAADVLLVAGGIGITPIYSMVRSLVRRRRPFRAIYAVRATSGHAYGQDLADMAGDSIAFLTSPSDARIDFPALLAAQSTGTQVYVCGPAAMIAAAQSAAAQLFWDPDRIRSEVFGAPSPHGDHAFDVELRRSGRLVHVGRDTTILDALTASGIPALSDCRRGECGLCPLDVIAADGGIDHRDRYLDAEDRAGGKTMCICVSRIAGARLVLDA